MSSGIASWVKSGEAILHVTAHQPTALAQDLCIVVVPPIGHEYTHSHSAIRLLCETLCAAGFFVARFDLAGTGNSTAADDRVPLLDSWVRNLGDVVAWTRTQSGCRHVAVAGLRIGANIAAIHAQRQPVHSVLLWAPCLRGAVFLRDCQMIGTATEFKKRTGKLDCGGIVLDAATQACFSTLRLDQGSLQTKQVCLLDRDDAPAAASVRSWLEAAEVELTVIEQAQYGRMMRQPMHAQVPVDAICAVSDWFRTGFRPATAKRCVDTDPVIGSVMAARSAEVPPAHPETFCYVGDDALFGILHRPQIRSAGTAKNSVDRFGSNPATDVVLIPNTGGTHHTGPCNLHVSLARALADVGIASFRFDLGNLGDSVTGMPPGVDQPYPRRAWRDVSNVLQTLHAQYGYTRFAVAGLCSGAYSGFQALNRYSSGVSPHPIVLTVMINPAIYYWDEKLVKNDCLDSGRYDDMVSAYTETLASTDKLRKLLSGEVNLLRAITTTLQRLLKKVQSALHGAMDRAGLVTSRIAQDLQRAAKRGCQVRIYAADSDPAIAILQNLGGHSVRRLMANGTLPVTVLNGADHTFSAVESRDSLIQAVVGDLCASGVEPAVSLTPNRSCSPR